MSNKLKKNNLFIGTSGWLYADWDKIFYPPNLNSEEKLKFYAHYFNSLEINSSFYHFPRPKTFQKWYTLTPKNFRFAIKVNRLITHLKRFKNIQKIWRQFLFSSLELKEKLGPFLFQFPRSFLASPNNIERVNTFLKKINQEKNKRLWNLKLAFEFRHQSWFQEKIYNLFKSYRQALVFADSAYYPKCNEITADFLYLRFHGPTSLFSSKYSHQEMIEVAKKIKKWQKNKLEIYVYFNNDVFGYALENAMDLKKILKV